MSSLEKYLQYNGGFSLLSGSLLLLFSEFFANIFGLTDGLPFQVVGGGLLAFGAFVFFVSQRQLGNTRLIQVITALDAFWVLGSLGIVVFQLFNLNAIGYLLITLIMVIIAIFAVNQYRLNK